ncbi:MAG: hypothetical protein PHR52_13575 [Fermentimonas sp.]|nr:hypothetical protein [Fermentimonas sp.]MEA5080821.1 hypothetical protein [Dysgonamonadaceae bacterium]
MFFRSLVVDYPVFLSEILYNSLPYEAHQAIIDKAKSNGWITLNQDIEEYLSKVTDQEVLSYIKNMSDADLTDSQLKNLLWRNFNEDDGTPIWKAKNVVKQQQLASDTI